MGPPSESARGQWSYATTMDVERTIQFILDNQAKVEVRLAKMAEHMAKVDDQMARRDARMDRMEERIQRMETRFDKRINALAKIVQAGMKMLVNTQTTVKELAGAQMRTERKLEALIDSLRNGRHGR